MQKIKLFTITILLSLITVAFGQENPQELIKNIREKYKTLNDISADMIINSTQKSKISFLKPAFLRIENKNMLIVSDGETSKNYDKKQKKLILSTVKDKSLSPEYYLFNLPDNAEAKAERDGNLIKLILIPKKGESGYKTLTVWTTSDYLIKKLLMKDLNDNEIKIEMTNTKVNTGLSKNNFDFENPQGAKIIDLR